MATMTEINKAGEEVFNAGQRVINDWVFKYDQKDLERYNKTNFPRENINKKIKDIRYYIRPNYVDENVRSMLAQENMLLTEEFIIKSISDASIFRTGNKQMDEINKYNVRNYAQKKLYNSNIQRYKDKFEFNQF
tara:strand:+ start:1932 stop:2333 length:402 start_codon:yes stop_codon:yes gene_type:complete